jgi:hypothetical protein
MASTDKINTLTSCNHDNKFGLIHLNCTNRDGITRYLCPICGMIGTLLPNTDHLTFSKESSVNGKDFK